MKHRRNRIVTDVALHWVWAFIDRANQAGFSPREETMTEVLLVSMNDLGFARVAIKKSVGNEESENGADFAWALLLPSGEWLDLLIQAKKLNPESGSYPELAGPRAGDQLHKLIAAAAAWGSLPIYLFYNDSTLATQGDRLEFGACQRRHVLRGYGGPPWIQGQTGAGCTIISAHEVRRRYSRGTSSSPAALLEKAMPWECLFFAFGSTVASAMPSAGDL